MRQLSSVVLANFLSIAAMMAFIVVVGPLIRILNLQEWHGGVMMTVAGLSWMLLARSWGHASDRLGRKPVLMTAIAGFAVSYLLLALFLEYALQTHISIWVIVLALTLIRGLIGAFYAAIPVSSHALVADHVPAEKRTGAMAMIGASNALGMIFGPLLAGLLVAGGLVYPMYFATVLPVLALVVLGLKLPKMSVEHEADLPKLKLHDSRLRLSMFTALIAMSTVISAQMLVGFFAIDRLALSPIQAAQIAGYAMTGVGITLVLVQGIIMKKASVSAESLLLLGAIISAIGFALVTLTASIEMLIISYCVAAAGLGLIFPVMQTLTANSVEPNEQGAAAGSVSAVQGFAMIIAPLAATLLYQVNPSLPYAVCALLLLALAIVAYRHDKTVFNRQTPSNPTS